VELSDWRRWWKRRGEDELRSLLLAAWDPIGVKDEPPAADEYDSYMLPLARKLYEGASTDDLTSYLDRCETEMGCGDEPQNALLAERILGWYADSTARFAEPI
jgi:hypothetical protein